jgi:murein DD-endopeptidase MepM/ murein hydrolase activator NlpD
MMPTRFLYALCLRSEVFRSTPPSDRPLAARARLFACASLASLVAVSAACGGAPDQGDSSEGSEDALTVCAQPKKDRVGNSLQSVYDALYRAETGTGFQRVNKVPLPSIVSGKSWVNPVTVPPSQWRAFGVISTPLERKNGGHEGVDIGVGRNTPVKAAGAGKIAYALKSCRERDFWCGNGWGNHVVIDHGDNVFTRYAHLTSVSVAVGSTVEAGALIGLSGTTGLSDGPHLHFELGVHAGAFDSCSAPQNFWRDVGTVKGGVYDPRLLSFGSSNPRANAIGKSCRVSAGGDRTANVRPEASSSASPYGVILAGQRVTVRGFIGDWASLEEAILDGSGSKPALSKVGHAVGLDAFLHVSQVDLGDCRAAGNGGQ